MSDPATGPGDRLSRSNVGEWDPSPTAPLDGPQIVFCGPCGGGYNPEHHDFCPWCSSDPEQEQP